MILGRVTGSIYSTIQHPFYAGKSLLVVESVGPDGQVTGEDLVAVDTVGAGPGELVLVVDEGTGARQILESTTGPIRSVIVGIVDDVSA